MLKRTFGFLAFALLACGSDPPAAMNPPAASCSDGLRNGGETDADCGGSCGPCADGRACSATADCTSGVCQGGTCHAAACGDKVKNGSETGIDCGGACGPCADGGSCSAAKDCASGVCEGKVCAAASCMDTVKNGSETATDCGGACGPCGDGQACAATTDCASKVCTGSVCAAASCTDTVKNGSETDADCGGACGPCDPGKACTVQNDCTGVCASSVCRLPASCAELHTMRPDLGDGVYSLAPDGTQAFSAYCDMTRDGGGWTLVLKADGGTLLGYNSAYWTDGNLLNQTDLGLNAANAKYQSFLSIPTMKLRGELDGTRFTLTLAAPLTAQKIFQAASILTAGAPPVNAGKWSFQPNCQFFGTNTPYNYERTRFGWTANQENDCSSNDTAIGFGLNSTGGYGPDRGAGYGCLSSNCSQGGVDSGGTGLLWVQ